MPAAGGEPSTIPDPVASGQGNPVPGGAVVGSSDATAATTLSNLGFTISTENDLLDG